MKVLKALMDLRAKISTDYESGEIRAHLKGDAESPNDLVLALRGLSSLTKYCIVKPYLTIKLSSDEFSKGVKSLRKFCSASVSTREGAFKCVKAFTNLTVFLDGRIASGIVKAYFLRGGLKHPNEVTSKIQLFIPCSELSDVQLVKPLNSLLSYLKESLR